MSLFRRRRAAPVDHVHPETPEQFAQQEQQWRRVVAEHGVMVMHVVGDDDAPGFHFTVGLTPHDLPEVIAYGLPAEVGHRVLDDLARRLLTGRAYADGEVVPGLVQGDYRVQLWTATDLQDPLGAAFRLYGEDAVRVRQLVLPDLQDRLPWDDGYALGHLQPVLFCAPDGSPPHHVEPDEHADPDGWDLPLDPHLGVIAVHTVLDGERPVRLVVHDDEGDWQFLDGSEQVGVDDAALVCLHHLLEVDPSLHDVVRDLPRAREAERTHAAGAWHQHPYVPEPG